MERWRENEEVARPPRSPTSSKSLPVHACFSLRFLFSFERLSRWPLFQLVTYVGETLLKRTPFKVNCFQVTENLNLEMKKKERVFDVFTI